MRKSILSFCICLVLTGCCSGLNNLADGIGDRASLLDSLRKAGALDSERQLVHFSHTCNVHVEGATYFVVDIRELVRGAVVARGINHILVLDSSLKLVRKIEYTTERPLYCRDDQLFVYGDLMIDGLLPEGNVLTFSEGASQISISQVDTNALPGEARIMSKLQAMF